MTGRECTKKEMDSAIRKAIKDVEDTIRSSLENLEYRLSSMMGRPYDVKSVTIDLETFKTDIRADSVADGKPAIMAMLKRQKRHLQMMERQ